MLELSNASGTFDKLFRLDPAPRYRLDRSPLVQVLGQVHFPMRPKLNTVDGIAPIQQGLEPIFPYMKLQQVQQVSLVVGSVGGINQASQIFQSWHFTNDSGWSLSVSPDSASLTVEHQYTQFSEFSDRFREILSVLAISAGISRADRLGVRYMNVAEVPLTDEGSWRNWFRPELTGWSASEVVSDSTTLITSITQTQLTAAPIDELSGPPVDVQGIVRHGLIPAGTIVPLSLPMQLQNPAFLLDIDLFVDAPQRFDPEELSRQVTILHDQIDRFFFWAVADDGATYFGREVIQQ